MADYSGWVSLHRKTIESPIYSDSQAVHLWVHLLLSANHKDNTFVKNGSLVTVKRGQLLTGRTLLSAATGLSESKVQRLLETFVSLEMIEQQTNSKSRLISITNYDSYQSTEQQMNSKRTTDEQQLNTNNNVNNDNNLFTSSEDDKPMQKIPYETIFDLFTENCVSLPKVLIKDDKRKALIKSIWNMDKQHQDIEFFKWLFNKIESSDFLTGRKTEWKSGFDWVMKPANFKKIVEGNYDNQ